MFAVGDKICILQREDDGLVLKLCDNSGNVVDKISIDKSDEFNIEDTLVYQRVDGDFLQLCIYDDNISSMICTTVSDKFNNLYQFYDDNGWTYRWG